MSEYIELAKKCGATEYGDQKYFDGNEFVADPRLLISGYALKAYSEALRAKALEEAANQCEEIEEWFDRKEGYKWPELQCNAVIGARDCAAKLRRSAAELRAVNKKEGE